MNQFNYGPHTDQNKFHKDKTFGVKNVEVIKPTSPIRPNIKARLQAQLYISHIHTWESVSIALTQGDLFLFLRDTDLMYSY